MTWQTQPKSWPLMLAVLVAALAGVTRSAARSPEAAARPDRHASITRELDCSSCHDQSSWKMSVATAGVSGGFDHSRTGFPLTGQHARTACVDCHHGDRPAARACASCHSDAHQRRLGQFCDRCHSANAWADVSGMRLHRTTRLPLSGMHALATCSECHVHAADNDWSGVPADCYACHAGDYQRDDLHPLHRGVPGDPAKPALPKNCAGCHRTISWSPAFAPVGFRFREGVSAQSQALSRVRHDSVFPLSFGKHARLACTDCHLSEQAPKLIQCGGCHAHDAAILATQHRGLVSVGANCLTCHPGGARR